MRSKRHSKRAIGGCGLLCVLAASASAQEALRESLAGERIAEQNRQSLANQPYNLRLGDFKMVVSATQGFEYNDRVNYTSLNPQSDFILRPMLNLYAVQPIGEVNKLNFSLGIGYEKYIDHSAYDSLLITPGSELSFDVFVKDIRINFHENLSYQNDPGREASVSGTGKYGGLNNRLGTAVTWDLEDVVLSASYDYTKFISSTSTFNAQDRDSHLFLVRSGFKVHPTATIGLEATAGPTYYAQPRLNDNFSTSIGAYADWQPTPYMHLQPRAGYSQYSFTENQYYGKMPSEGGSYFGLNFNHRINRFISYTVDGGRELRPSVGANLSTEYRASGSINLHLIERLSLSSGINYTQGEQMGSLNIGNNQQYDLTSITFGAGYQLMEKLSTSLSYTHSIRTSNYQNGDYAQNRVTLNLTYRF
jgi:hypothetical protein